VDLPIGGGVKIIWELILGISVQMSGNEQEEERLTLLLVDFG
jgi:hypothetical protein